MKKKHSRLTKIKIIKIEKREKKGRRKKKRGAGRENSTELQKSNIEAGVYNNNKNVTEEKEKKSLKT